MILKNNCSNKQNKEQTPRGQIIHILRTLWLRSRERGTCLKRAKYSCQDCGKKKSAKKGFEQKVEVHHKEGILNWGEIVDLIRAQLLCSPEKLEALCPDCHEKKDAKNKQVTVTPK